MLENPKVVEIFGPVIQGEGSVIGMPTIFIRTGGCDFRCTWCDSDHAVLPVNRDRWISMSPAEIVLAVEKLARAPASITLSGGNPAIMPMGPTIAALRAAGYGPIIIETQGTAAPGWLANLDAVTVSPKPPSSGENFDYDIFARFLDSCGDVAVSIKVVVMNRADLDFAHMVQEDFGGRVGGDLFLQPGNKRPKPGEKIVLEEMVRDYRDLVDMVLSSGMRDVRILPQLHVWAWGGGEGV
jgi:7-carboxy-7-deazaguanine synthase